MEQEEQRGAGCGRASERESEGVRRKEGRKERRKEGKAFYFHTELAGRTTAEEQTAFYSSSFSLVSLSLSLSLSRRNTCIDPLRPNRDDAEETFARKTGEREGTLLTT